MIGGELFVCVKQAVAVHGGLVLAPGDKTLAPECRRWVVNEADGFALEEALRLREQGVVTGVTCVTAGPPAAREMLAWCLAMGADRALRIDVPEGTWLDPNATGAVLAAAVRHLGGRLVFGAQRSDDGRSGMVPAAVAHALGAVYLSNATAVRLNGETVEIHRKLERGHRQVWAAALPAVVAFEPGGNIPRYVSVAALILAQRRAVEELAPPTLGVRLDELPRLNVLHRLTPPRVRPKKTVSLTAGQSVTDRLKTIMSGGMTDKKEKKVLRGGAEELAAEVVRLLKERQILGRDGL